MTNDNKAIYERASGGHPVSEPRESTAFSGTLIGIMLTVFTVIYCGLQIFFVWRGW